MDSSDGAGQAAESNAERLLRKHEAEEAHHTTVEEVVDEEDVLHPPPSASVSQSEAAAASSDGQDATVSSDATGSAAGDAARPKPSGSKGSNAPLDMASHEAFPQLGAGSQPRASRPVSTAWNAQKSSSLGGRANGTHAGSAAGGRGLGSTGASSATSSRASTPATSGVITPPSMPAHQRGASLNAMSIPGRYSERISLLSREMKPRSQLKKPVPDILRELNRRSKANVQMSSGANGAVHFDAAGPVDAVRQALKEVARELGSKQSIKVTVPASVRPHIIGRQGTVIQSISQRTGAYIQIPRPGDPDSPGEADDDTMIDVLIEGDSVAAAMARREIENIVNERTSNVSVKLKDIPAELYPFLAGPHNAHISAMEDGKDLSIHVPSYHTWLGLPPPQATSATGLPSLPPPVGMPISISGDRLAAQAARAEIERRAEELKRQLTLSRLDLDRGRHQFVLGKKGASQHDFLAETGCVVGLPPSTQDTETLTVVGPPDKVEEGINKVMELAFSMQMTNVDIAKQHPHAPRGGSAHARNLTRYLQRRREIERLERSHNAHVAIPSAAHGPSTWEIYSREGKNTIRARSDIINIVNAHPPARLSMLNIEPFFHQHLQRQASKTIQDDYGVYLVFPDDGCDESVVSEVLLVYEGPEGRTSNYEASKKLPTAEELHEFRDALSKAEVRLLGSVDMSQKIITKVMPVPKKFEEKLHKFILRDQQTLAPGELPVQFQLGEARLRNGQPDHVPGSTLAAALDSELILRGPVAAVDALADKIVQFLVEEQENERERGFTLTFEFPQKFSNHLIGRKGENIRNLREEFDVDIQVQDGKIEVKGPKAKAEAAKARILALRKRLEEEATHVLKIHPQYHKDLIGSRGSQVNRLQDRYNVRITFPRNISHNAKDDQSAADSASDIGGAHTSPRGHQEHDEVIVRGPKKGADEARDEILSLLQWTVDNSHAGTVSVALNQVPLLIGQGGREMERIRMTTGAQVDVPDVHRNGADKPERVTIRLKGTKQQVNDAKQVLEKRAREFDDTVTRTLKVDRKHHKSLIGGGGANIRDIVMKAGGPDDRRELARMVRFPNANSDDDSIRIEGNRAVVDRIAASIEELVKRRENEVVDTIKVAPEKHRMLIGHGGQTRRQLESDFKVTIDIPKQNETGEARNSIKISGLAEDVARAKNHIAEITKGGEAQTVQIPRRLHHAISDNGQLFRRLRNEYNVRVEHAGHQPPPRPSVPAAQIVGGAGDQPVALSENNNGNGPTWRLQDHRDDNSTAEGDIPWVLRGPPEKVALAMQQLEAARQFAERPRSTGYLFPPSTSWYRLVIGPGGSRINSVRQETGCRINVPKDDSKGEAIEIQGERDRVEEARDMIIKMVTEEGDEGRRGPKGPRRSGGGRGGGKA